jgi:hypothetical protein
MDWILQKRGHYNVGMPLAIKWQITRLITIMASLAGTVLVVYHAHHRVPVSLHL